MLAAVGVAGCVLAAQEPDSREAQRAATALRLEGEAVVGLADAAAAGETVPADFTLDCRIDLFKAQPGTFVAFVLRVETREASSPSALLYVRAARRRPESGKLARLDGPPGGDAPMVFHPFEEIYPITLAGGQAPVRIARGFSLPAGEYDLTFVVRAREGEPERVRRRPPPAAVLRRPLSVPDFGAGQLTTSSVILADRLTVLPEAEPAGQAAERPYVLGNREVHPATDSEFGRNEELVVAFLVYDPAVRPDKHFDLQVEYHFFRKTGAGEEYFNRTEPQRFNPAVLGPSFDPSGGQPVLAGQGVPLAEFREGEYRLSIRIKDLVSGQDVERDVTFTVRS